MTASEHQDLPESSSENEEGSSFFSTLRALSPYLGVCILASVLATFGATWVLNRFVGYSLSQPPQVVTFDLFKYLNAQRAVAEAFIKPSSARSLSASQILANMPEKTRRAIAQVAGPGTLVVIKQAVVQGQTRDITDQVLRLLSLPTNVPSTIGTPLLGGGLPVLKIEIPGSSDGAASSNQLP